jgi:hypothetical protein
VSLPTGVTKRAAAGHIVVGSTGRSSLNNPVSRNLGSLAGPTARHTQEHYNHRKLVVDGTLGFVEDCWIARTLVDAKVECWTRLQ